MDARVGFVGLGLVGTALARRACASGFRVVGTDIDASRSAPLAEAGGTWADSVREVASSCVRVVLALYDDEQTLEVVEALVAAPAAVRAVIDVHTGDPAVAERIASRLAEHGIGYVDAPLSGSSEAIGRGEGIAMIGGVAQALEACDDFWPVLGSHHVIVGGAGSGQKAKLATNLILGLNRAALAEGLALAEALGLDGAAFLDLVRATPAYSRAVDAKGARMLERRYEPPESRIRQHRKDLALIASCAARVGRDVPLTNTHAALLDAAIAAGDGDLDNAAIVETLRRGATVSPSPASRAKARN